MDLEKAFYRVPREVIRWAMRKLEVEEWLVSEVMSMYTGAKTVVTRRCSESAYVCQMCVPPTMHQPSPPCNPLMMPNAEY